MFPDLFNECFVAPLLFGASTEKASLCGTNRLALQGAHNKVPPIPCVIVYQKYQVYFVYMYMSRCMVIWSNGLYVWKKYFSQNGWLKLGLLWIRDLWPIVLGGFLWRSALGAPPRAKISETCHFQLFLLLPFQRWPLVTEPTWKNLT